MRSAIERAVQAALVDFARVLEGRLQVLMAAHDDKQSKGPNASAGTRGQSARPRPVALSAMPIHSKAPAKAPNGARKRTAPMAPTSAGLIEAKLLVALSDGASIGRKALLAKARIRSNDSERAYAVLVRLRAQGKVVLRGEKRFAEYQLASGASAVDAQSGRQRAGQSEVASSPARTASNGHTSNKSRRASKLADSPSGSDASEVAHSEAAPEDDAFHPDVPILRALTRDRPLVFAAVDLNVNVLQALTIDASVPMEWLRVDLEDTTGLTGLITRARNWEIAALVIVRTDRDEAWATALADIVRASGVVVLTVNDATIATITEAMFQLDRAVASAS
ncbi:MAG: hypothetical protein ACHREM_20870 [Polyangiales bacterium]